MTPEETFKSVVEDSFTTFSLVKDWKRATGGKALGYFPVYFPVEIAHALDYLPVAMLGASGKVGLDMATAHTQSFVCSISRSVFQLGLQGNLDAMDLLVYSNICDVARNLSGITKRAMGERAIEYLHYPINNTSPTAVGYLCEEYKRLAKDLGSRNGGKLTDERLWKSIALFNRKRALELELARLRKDRPWAIPYTAYYTALRAGTQMPVEKYIPVLEEYLGQIRGVEGKARDSIRVLVLGTFCEQPPVAFMRTIEEAGCYVVDDEALVGERWLGQVHNGGGEDPLTALSSGYVNNPDVLTVRYHPGIDKQKAVMEKVKQGGAEGVIFCTPKFCEPALYDYMIDKPALEKAKIPYIHIEYEESASSFEHARTMVETFSESILFD